MSRWDVVVTASLGGGGWYAAEISVQLCFEIVKTSPDYNQLCNDYPQWATTVN
jgi:hypothetical protein